MLFPTARRAPLQKSVNYRYQLGFQCLALYTFVRWPPFHSLPASRRCLHASIPFFAGPLAENFCISISRYSVTSVKSTSIYVCYFGCAMREFYGRYTLIPPTNFFLIILLCFFSCYLIEAFAYFAGRCNKRYKYKINQCDACVTLYYTLIRQISFIWMDRRIRMK